MTDIEKTIDLWRVPAKQTRHIGFTQSICQHRAVELNFQRGLRRQDDGVPRYRTWMGDGFPIQHSRQDHRLQGVYSVAKGVRFVLSEGVHSREIG